MNIKIDKALLEKYFPMSFGAKDLVEMIIRIVIYVVAGIIVGLLCSVVGLIPLIGGIVGWIVGTVSEIYVLLGIVLLVLDYLKVLKLN